MPEIVEPQFVDPGCARRSPPSRVQRRSTERLPLRAREHERVSSAVAPRVEVHLELGDEGGRDGNGAVAGVTLRRPDEERAVGELLQLLDDVHRLVQQVQTLAREST